jgi:alpha-beta hydrolase superfamily lysophospholipase
MVESALPSGLYYRHWRVEAPRAVLLLAHGAGEHSGRYLHLADFLGAHGIAVLAPDHPGHGKSPGRRAHIEAFAQFFPALDALCEQAERDYPEVPLILLGHSMGGLIAARYLLERPGRFRAAVLSAPALAPPAPPSAFAIWLNTLLSKLWPTLGVLQLDAGGISRDPAVVAAYRADPLVHTGKFSARLVTELFAAMEEVHRRAVELRLPLLLMHGDADSMTAVEGSRSLAREMAAEYASLRIYPGLYHEIFNEPEQQQVFADLLDWLQSKLPAAG